MTLYNSLANGNNRKMKPALLLILAGAIYAQDFDLVIANGRVMDPATNLDSVRHIGIRGATIAALSRTPA